MKYEFYTTDVFTDRAFGGNPLAVFPRAEGLSGEVMQKIACEFNLSETTFVLPPEKKEHTRKLRIFTPQRELIFAGHPTVGTAFVLARIGEIPLAGERTNIVFEEGVGPIPVEIRAQGGEPEFCTLTTAVLPEVGPAPPPSETLAAMLSVDPQEIKDDADDEPQAISCGVPFLFIPLQSLDAVRRSRLNWEWWQQCLASFWSPHPYVFSYETEHPDTHIHARMFGAAVGIEEDPATGAAASALAGYLGLRDKTRDGTLRWTIEQGIEMGRPSRIELACDKKAGKIAAVRVGGCSVMMSEGRMEIPG
jgi:trans-2,3-dihydro-3-hydroxyanthranilate isomerase